MVDDKVYFDKNNKCDNVSVCVAGLRCECFLSGLTELWPRQKGSGQKTSNTQIQKYMIQNRNRSHKLGGNN